MKIDIINENNPIWIDMEESEFERFLEDCLINENDTLDVEKLLLARMTSKSKDIVDWAARRLYIAYVFGSFRIGDENVCMGYVKFKCKYPDYDKIKVLTPKVVLDDEDLNSVLYLSQYYKYDKTALEAALIAMEKNEKAKTILYFLYRDGIYIEPLYDLDVIIKAPELKTQEKYNTFIAKNAAFIKEHNLEEMKRQGVCEDEDNIDKNVNNLKNNNTFSF